jgi:hypothetical protein
MELPWPRTWSGRVLIAGGLDGPGGEVQRRRHHDGSAAGRSLGAWGLSRCQNLLDVMPNLLAGVEAEVLGAEPGRRALGAWGFGRCVFVLVGFEVVAQALDRGAHRRRNVGRIGQRRQLRERAHPERPGQAGFRQQDHEAAAFEDARDVQVEGVGHVFDVEPVDGAGIPEALETGLGAGAG